MAVINDITVNNVAFLESQTEHVCSHTQTKKLYNVDQTFLIELCIFHWIQLEKMREGIPALSLSKIIGILSYMRNFYHFPYSLAKCDSSRLSLCLHIIPECTENALDYNSAVSLHLTDPKCVSKTLDWNEEKHKKNTRMP